MSTGYVDAAMRTALHLMDYDDIIDPVDSYSLLGECRLWIAYTVVTHAVPESVMASLILLHGECRLWIAYIVVTHAVPESVMVGLALTAW